MKNRETILRISKLVAKILFRAGFYFLLIVLVVVSLLQLKPVQTYVTQQVLSFLSEQTNHEISVSSVRIAWLDRAELSDFLLLDLKGDTLAYADGLMVNYKVKDLINKDLLNVEEVSTEFLKVQLIKHDSLSALNLTEFLESLKSDKERKESKPLSVEEIDLSNFEFSLIDKSKPSIENKIDFSHLDVDFSEFQLSDLWLVSDTIQMEVIQIAGTESNIGLELKELRTNLSLNNFSLSLTDLELKTPTSHVSDSIKLYFNGLDDLSTFVDSVAFGFYLSDMRVSQEDLTLLVGEHDLKSAISFDGIIWGTVGDFNVEQSRLGFGNESFIAGGISCFGLPDLESTFALADITDSHLAQEDIEPYVGKLSQNLAQLGKLDFTGSFAGFIHDFVARGDFVTEKGSVHSDINLKIPSDINEMSYKGNLELINVDVGAFLNNREMVQNVSMKGTIDGKGIKPENANFNLNAVAYNSGFYGYEYDSIRANGTFASNFFEGSFSVDDPNCKVIGFADLDLNRDVEELEVDVHVDSVHLHTLNFSSDSISIFGNVKAKVANLDIDTFVGEAEINKAHLKLDQSRDVPLDSIKFIATLNRGVRRFELTMPGVKADLKGKFKITDAINDLSVMASYYASKISLEKDTLERRRSGSTYSLDFYAELDEPARYLDSLGIPIQVSPGTFIEAAFRESKSANVSLFSQSEFLKIGNVELRNPTLEINGSKELDADQVLTNFIIESSRQSYEGIPETRNLLVEGIWFDNSIDLTASVRQESTETAIRLSSHAQLSREVINLKFQPSRILIFGDEWSFNPQNAIDVYGDRIEISNLEIHDESESIALSGAYSDVSNSNIQLAVERLKLSKANLFTESNINGFLDGRFDVFRSAPTEPFQFDGGFLLSELYLDDFLVGSIEGSSEWDPGSKSIYTNVKVDRENFREIELEGYYYPLNKQDQLDFTLSFDQADLRLAQSFLQDNISNLKGFASGNLKLTGSVEEPQAIGGCTISGGEMTVNYLNTHYLFDGAIRALPDALRFENFNLTDRKGARANIGGSITHENFGNIKTAIQLNADNFEFLNTTPVDNNLYYGSANGTGLIEVGGPLNDLLIKATIKTDKGTRFYIPVTEGGGVSQEEYIAFVDFNDSTSNQAVSEYSFQGMTLEFDIEVTPDAYCELIFDIKTGDIIRGRGRGNIKLRLDTDGEFNMFGPLEITEGGYNFTALGVISKEFSVIPGSRITWFGDPYDATIDLDAAYLQRTNFEPLVSEAELSANDIYRNNVGVNVMLNLDGGMLTPDLGFELQMVEDLGANDQRSVILANLNENPEELNRQVISLLFLKKFSPQNSFFGGGSGDIGGSAGEFFSSQVSYLVSQLDENLEVELDLASLDADAFNTFQLRLAYTFLDGRLKITRGGNFSRDSENERVIDDILGDWSIEYTLTRDGRLRAKAFQATSQLAAQTSDDRNMERGVSLMFVHSFNEFAELLSNRREEAIRREEEEPEVKRVGQTIDIDTSY